MDNDATKKRPRGHPPKAYNTDHAKQVQGMSQYGVSCEDMAVIVGVDVGDMKRIYAAEIKKGRAIANAAMGKVLFERAHEGDAKAAAQWLRWKEVQSG